MSGHRTLCPQIRNCPPFAPFCPETRGNCSRIWKSSYPRTRSFYAGENSGGLQGRGRSRDVVVDRTVISLHQPQSRPAEPRVAFRTVRTAAKSRSFYCRVCFSALGKTHRVIQVTSPMAGDGKSTLAANFAVLLAQSGKKTLLLESDFRRPKIHQLTGVDNNVGVVDVLRGDAESLTPLRKLSWKTSTCCRAAVGLATPRNC